MHDPMFGFERTEKTHQPLFAFESVLKSRKKKTYGSLEVFWIILTERQNPEKKNMGPGPYCFGGSETDNIMRRSVNLSSEENGGFFSKEIWGKKVGCQARFIYTPAGRTSCACIAPSQAVTCLPVCSVRRGSLLGKSEQTRDFSCYLPDLFRQQTPSTPIRPTHRHFEHHDEIQSSITTSLTPIQISRAQLLVYTHLHT